MKSDLTKCRQSETSQQIFPYFSKVGQEKIIPFSKQTEFDFSILFNLPPRPHDPEQKPGQEHLETVKVHNVTASVKKLTDSFGCETKDILTKFGMVINERDAIPKVTKGWVECMVETVEEPPKKEGMVEGVKGFFGLGKKKDGDQEVLEEVDSKIASSEKASASAKPSTKEDVEVAPKIIKTLQKIPLDYTTVWEGFPEIAGDDVKGLISK